MLDGTPVGTFLTLNRDTDAVSGTFAGLDHDGALILRDHSGYDHRLTYGDVTLNAAPDSSRAAKEKE